MTAEKQMARAEALTAQGLCVACKQPMEKERIGKRYCRMCVCTYKDYKTVWLDAHPEARERSSRYIRELRQKRRENHLCTQCGTALPETDPRVACERCRERNNGLNRKNRKKQRDAAKVRV